MAQPNGVNGGDLHVEALSGGVVSLDSVTRIGDDTVGNADNYAYMNHTITADGTGSRIEAPVLTQLIDRDSYQLSTIKAVNGGEIAAPMLNELQRFNLVLDGTGTIPISQITSFTDGVITVDGSSMPGIAYTFPGLTNANGMDFLVQGDATLTLPGITNLTAEIPKGSIFRASGAGSHLSLPNLLNVVIPANNYSNLKVEALTGGVVSLPVLTQIADSATNGSYNYCTITADGAGSRIEAPVLTQLIDRDSFTLSTIKAINGGEIAAPMLNELQRFNLVLDGTGTIPISQITSFTDGVITVDGSSMPGIAYTFPGLTNANGMDFLVQGDATLTLPAVVNFTSDNSNASIFRATGVGSHLSLPNLQTIVAQQNGVSGGDLQVEALSGGVISLDSVTRIGDDTAGSAGNYTYVNHTLTADGTGSRIEAPVLTQLIDRNSYQLSAINAKNNGTIVLEPGNSTMVEYVIVDVSTGGTIEGSIELASMSTLKGTGPITGNVTNGGSVSPTGSFTIGGDYTQLAGGTLNIDVSNTGGFTVEPMHVGGTMTLDGTLTLTRTGGFEPALGASAQIFDASNITGSFSTLNGATLPNSKEFRLVSVESGVMTLLTVPAGILLGNFNSDTTVDAADYVVWRKNFGAATSPFAGADGNGDGIVDQTDYAFWRAFYGNSQAAGSVAAAALESESNTPVASSLDAAAQEESLTSAERAADDGGAEAPPVPDALPTQPALSKPQSPTVANSIARSADENSPRPLSPDVVDLAVADYGNDRVTVHRNGRLTSRSNQFSGTARSKDLLLLKAVQKRIVRPVEEAISSGRPQRDNACADREAPLGRLKKEATSFPGAASGEVTEL